MNATFEIKDYEEVLSNREIINAKYIFERGEKESEEQEDANSKKPSS